MDKSQLLRQASREVHLDDSQDLMTLAQELADERGLRSPEATVDRPHSQVHTAKDGHLSPERGEGSPAAESATSGLQEDYQALVDSMKKDKRIDPAVLKPNSIDGDYEVVARAQKTGARRSKSASASAAASGRYQQALQRKQRFREQGEAKEVSPERHSTSASRVSYSKSKQKFNAEACRLSKMLASYESQDGKPSLVQSVTQDMLFKTMRHLKASSKSSATACKVGSSSLRSSADSKEFFKNLSAPRESAMYQGRSSAVDTSNGDRTQIYAKYEDAEECTFKPKIKGLKNNYGGADAKAQSFVDRQESKENARRQDLEAAIGEAAYSKTIDKKYCPKCGAQQKFDEVVEKKKTCPTCNVLYCAKISWGKVSDSFFTKNKAAVDRAFILRVNPEEQLKRAQYEVKHIMRKIDDDYSRALDKAGREKELLVKDQRQRHVNLSKFREERLKVDPEEEYNKAVLQAEAVKKDQSILLAKAIEHEQRMQIKYDEFIRAEEKFRPKSGGGFTDKKWNSTLEEQFFNRMEESLAEREKKIADLEQEVQSQKYPFKPKIAARGKDDDDHDEGYDPHSAFLERLQSYVQTRREQEEALWGDRRRVLEQVNMEAKEEHTKGRPFFEEKKRLLETTTRVSVHDAPFRC